MNDAGTAVDRAVGRASGPRRASRRTAVAIAAVLSLAGIFGVSPQVVAATTQPALAGDGNVGTAPGQRDDAVRGYWTAQRMAGARDAGNAATPTSARAATRTTASAPGAPEVVEGSTGSLGPAPAGTAPENFAATPVPKPYTDLPDRLNGKVFFTMVGGGNFVCSGTLVNNSRKNLVVTAGHCVHGGEGGSFHRNWVFVPAYDGTKTGSGQRPYGTWTARELFTRQSWIDSSNNRQDIGVALLDDDSGTPLGELIGGQGITFNVSASQSFSDFGYPAAPPFNGTIQWRCNSTLRGRDTAIGGVGPDPLRIACDMTGGSSGGGWLINIGSDGLGHLNSVNSYGYPALDPGFEYGPYFGNEAKALYDFTKDRGPAPK